VHNPDRGGRCHWVYWTEEQQKKAAAAGEGEKHTIGQIAHRPMRHGALTKLQMNCKMTAQNHRIVTPIKRFDENNDVYDLTRVFMDEFLRHPFAAHDDLIDAVARIYDIDPQVPQIFESQSTEGLTPDDDDEPYIP
jgi:hypothetical protein